jgi:hypothetical protein
MKGTRSVLLCLIVALAAGALMAPGASAAEYGPKEFPEWGRCVKTALGAGTYKDAKCQFVARPEYGKTEWIPATAGEKFTFVAGGGEAVIPTVGHSTIKCIGTNISGTLQNEKTAAVVVELQGCLDQASTQCQNPGGINKSEISSGSLTAELGFIKNVEKTIVVGLDLKPPFLQNALFNYECGGGPTEVNSIEGSVIGKIKPIAKMTTEMKFIFKATKAGAQIPEKFEGGLPDTLFTTYKVGLETTGSGASSLNVIPLGEVAGAYSQPIEIRTKEVPFTG